MSDFSEMTLPKQNMLQLTAKQRLAVSRQALLKASKQPLWQGITTLASKGIVNFLVRSFAKSKESKP